MINEFIKDIYKSNIQKEKILFISLCLSVMITIILPILAIFGHVSNNYNEGWNAYHVDRLLNGGLLYPRNNVLTTNNYPPLSFYIVGALAYIVKDAIISGRIISLISLIIVSLSVGNIVRNWHKDLIKGIVASLIFILLNEIWFCTYTAINDPQWLGSSFQVMALSVIFSKNSRPNEFITNQRVLTASSFLLCLGVIVKHNLIALPAALALWLFVEDRRAFFYFVGISFAFIALISVLFYSIYGNELFVDVVLYKRVINIRRAIDFFREYIGFYAPCLALFFRLLVYFGSDKNFRFTTFYIGMALSLGFLSSAGEGVSINSLFEILISSSLGIGLLLSGEEKVGSIHSVNRRIACVVVIGLILLGLPRAITDQAGWFRRIRAAHDGSAEMVIRRLARSRGPVACEDLAWCYWAGKPFSLDFFNTGQKIKFGLIDQKWLARRISEEPYEIIQSHKGDLGHYFPDGSLKGVLMNQYAPIRYYSATILLEPVNKNN